MTKKIETIDMIDFSGGSVFYARQRSGSKLNTVFDADGNEIQVVKEAGFLPWRCESDLLFMKTVKPCSHDSNIVVYFLSIVGWDKRRWRAEC